MTRKKERPSDNRTHQGSDRTEASIPSPTLKEDAAKTMTGDASSMVCFSVAHQLQAIPVAEVAEVIQPPPITGLFRLPDFIVGVVSLRGEILAVVDLARLSGLGETALLDRSRLIVVQDDSIRFGLLVDEILGSVTMEPAQINEIQAPGSPTWITGVSHLDDRPVAILDVTRIVASPAVAQVRSPGRASIPTNQIQD